MGRARPHRPTQSAQRATPRFGSRAGHSTATSSNCTESASDDRDDAAPRVRLLFVDDDEAMQRAIGG
jgi:hypothetical protein